MSRVPSATPCAVFEPMLGPHVDRELTRAEEARVEAHLDTCATCRRRLHRLESLSSALRAWDVEPDRRPPERIRNAVLARVAETSRRRRADGRVLRLVHLATAASVLLALGLGVAFGLAFEMPVVRPETAAETAEVGAPSLAGLRLPDVAPDPGLPSMAVERDPQRLRGPAVPDRARAPRLAIGPLSTAQLARLEAFARRLERERALEQAVGERGVHVAVGPDGETRVLSRSAYVFARERGWLDRWRPSGSGSGAAAGASAASATASSVSPTAPRPTGTTLADMVGGITGLDADERAALAEAPPMTLWPRLPGNVPPEERLVVLGLPAAGADRIGPRLRSGHGHGAAVRTVDPLVAQAKGWLRFEESGVDADTVVAFVKGSPRPILLPAGQILAQGVTDRVVAEPVLLPASATEQRENVRCRVVRVGERRSDSASPVLTEWIAGPTIRALLAEDADDETLVAAVERLVRGRLRLDHGTDPRYLAAFSLRELFETPAGTARAWAGKALAALRAPGSVWQADRHAGFVVLDGDGGVLGVELVSLEGGARQRLLTRLYLGYQLEAALRGAGSTETSIGAPRLDLAGALALVQEEPRSFLGVRASAGDAALAQRVSRLALEHAGMVFAALELDEAPALVSGAPLPR